VDAGADVTLGGVTVTNASGATAVKYGVMRDHIGNLEVVLADGSSIHTGSIGEISTSGVHLNWLLAGAGGFLRFITEVSLKVHGIPEHTMAERETFPDIQEATEAVIAIMQAGIPIARVELVDEASIQQIITHSDTAFSVAATLFMEFHGNEAGLQQDIEFMESIVEDYQCQEIFFETDHRERLKLWE